jgi:hypothetical protein
MLTSLFVTQASRVWKSQTTSFTFWILDSCNASVSDKKYTIQKPELIMSTNPLLSLEKNVHLHWFYYNFMKIVTHKPLLKMTTFVLTRLYNRNEQYFKIL